MRWSRLDLLEMGLRLAEKSPSLFMIPLKQNSLRVGLLFGITVVGALLILIFPGSRQPIPGEASSGVVVPAGLGNYSLQTGFETVQTEKADYPPEETVQISGNGYAPLCDVTVRVTRPDGSIITGDGSGTPGSDTVTTDLAGSFAYGYILDGVNGTYTVDVLDGNGNVLATMTFTDAPAIKTYLESARTTERETFERGDTVYAKADGLATAKSYTFEVLDKNGTSKAVTGCATGATTLHDQ